jgi:glycosyltransferase involved in cell wall biosynthesis
MPVRRLPVRLAPGLGVAVSPSLVSMLRAELAAGGYDVLHAHVSVISPLAYAAIVAARRLGLPTVVTFHSVLHGKAHVLRAANALLGFARWPLVLSAVSELVAGQLRRAVAGPEVIVLPNGVDPRRWRSAGARMYQAKDGLVVVSAMRLHRKKRPLPLLRAFGRAGRMAASHGRRLALRIAGDGPQRAALQRQIARHCRDMDVMLLGAVPREQLAAVYADADLFVLPSRREAFGLAALEARCAGLPVVAMRDSGAVDFLQHEQTALLAADDAALAAAIVRLALDDDLRARLAPPDPALDRYAWPNVINAHVAAYGRAIGALPR